jgi:hypothetical protein
LSGLIRRGEFPAGEAGDFAGPADLLVAPFRRISARHANIVFQANPDVSAVYGGL